MIQQTVTQEDIESVKARVAKIAALRNRPTAPPVFKQTIAKHDFLYTWITEEEYQGIIGKRDFIDAMKKDPDGAEKFLRTMVIQECVLWPPTFNIGDPVSVQAYPAGVVPSLMDAIMFSSGFSTDPAPEELVVPPEEPKRASEEEVMAAINNHSVAKIFGAHEKTFYLRSINRLSGREKLTPVRHYIYTSLTRDDYRRSQGINGDDEKKDYILSKCVLWPQNLDWENEPAGYGTILFAAILERSGFGRAEVENGREV